jgi:hypothetical protein
MKKIILIASYFLTGVYGWTQGCVAIRNVAAVSPDL